MICNTPKIFLVLFLAGLLGACSTTPIFETQNVNLKLQPQQAIELAKTNTITKILWGGTVIEAHNLKEVTQIEVLAYPLNSSYRPIKSEKPLGRFLIKANGYLEPAIYTAGRLITVQGNLSGIESGAIGEHKYTYPVVKSEQLQLWTDKDESNTQFHFGIGIGIRN